MLKIADRVSNLDILNTDQCHNLASLCLFNFLAALMAVTGMVVLGWARWLAGRLRKRDEVR